MRRVLILLLLACLLPAVFLLRSRGRWLQKKHKVTLKWQAPVPRTGENIVGYDIYRSDEENGAFGLIAEKVNALTYIDSDVQSGHTYYYRVTSRDTKGRESIPATINATVP